jgi:class 3 adenylate cyclase
VEALANQGAAARVVVWGLHLAAPMAGLWLLVARPDFDLRWEHRPAHFWLILAVAGINVWLAWVINEAARRRADARLFLVALAFLAAAAFLGLHAAATPGMGISGPNVAFTYASPVGLAVAAMLATMSAVDLSPRRSATLLRRGGWLRAAVFLVVAVLFLDSLFDPDPPSADVERPVLLTLAVVSVGLYSLAAWQFFAMYRRRRAVMLLSVTTAYVLLAESMVAMAFARNWHASWWEWHLLMAAGFGYVAYSANVQYRHDGTATSLFASVGGDNTVRQVSAEYNQALEALVAAVGQRERGELTETGMAAVTASLARRFELTEGQAMVLDRAAAALSQEREQIRHLDALVDVGRQSRVLLAEHDLLRGAVARIAGGFDRMWLRIGLLDQGRLVFPSGYGAGPPGPDVPLWMVDAALPHAAAPVLATREPLVVGAGAMVLPLTVKGHPAGVLAVQEASGTLAARDRALLVALAGQLSIALENARLYRQLDVLFRQYMSPDVATALIADPSQAALGGAVIDVTALFAGLRGFTAFSEHSSPAEVMAMLNQYFDLATRSILAERGTVVQFAGDTLMALFNAPVRQADHAAQAARAALATQSAVDGIAAQRPGWPRFRIGINSGEALVGNIGGERLRSFNAMGDPVNVAARLENQAEPGEVVIGAMTYQALAGRARVSPLGDLMVLGRQQPVTAYVLHGLAGV